MNYDTYIDLISEEKYNKATSYKISCIPDILYKYFWLDNNEKNNELRLSALEKGKIYLSTLNQFNDPFEGNMFFFDEEELLKKNWRKETFKDFIKQMNNHARICCFTSSEEKQQNMPMWAYYANNHHGFCVEYKMTNSQKKFLYPVSYDNCRVNGNALLGNLINGIVDMVQKDISEMPGEISGYNHLAYLSLASKHSSWQHEKEIRALVPLSFGEYFPAIPQKIYIGMFCSKKNKKRLIEVAKKFPNCEVYQMQGIAENSSFCLREERIL